MKKVFFSLAVLATVALVSCGGKKAEEACDTDTAVAVVEEVAVVEDSNADSAAVVEAAAEEVAPAEAPAEEKK